jgi:hypothetical protein
VSGVRFAGRFQPGYKLDPRLVRSLAPDGSTSEATELDVLLFAGEEPEPLIEALAARHPETRVAHVRRRDPARVTLEVPQERIGGIVGSLIRDPAVAFVERRLPLVLDNDQSVWIGQSYDRSAGPLEALEPDPKPYAVSATIWSRGLTGAGQVVAVADTGLERDLCFFADTIHPVALQTVPPPAPLAVDAAHRKVLAVNAVVPGAHAHDDTFRHGSHVAATAVGDDLGHLAGGPAANHDHGDGMAPAAKLVFEDVGATTNSSCSASVTIPSIGDLFEQEYAAGARISTNSWGSGTGVYGSGAADTDDVAWRHEDFLVVYSAGNSAGAGVNNTAACKNCLAVGATETWNPGFASPFGGLDPENLTAFSSRGPAADGRIKPDLTAPGYLVTSARFPVQYFSNSAHPSCDAGDPDVCFPFFGGCYVMDSSQTCSAGTNLGTSMAAPTVAGLAALARQYFTDGFYPSGASSAADARVPSAALLRAVLLNGARNMTGHVYERRGANQQDLGPLLDAPSPYQGWGRVMLDDALYFTGDARRLFAQDVPNAEGLVTGQMTTTLLTVTASGQPLEATLTWTDPPAAGAAGAARVSDLDLEIVDPSGTTFLGNQWTSDIVSVPGDVESLPNPPGRDALNTVEGVLVPVPAVGTWTVRVIARSVPGHDGVETQGHALVVTGAVLDGPAPAPPPVPDGTFGSAMTARRVDASGADLELTWDAATCPASDYHVLYGPLSQVGSLALSGAACDLGTAGTLAWSGVPDIDLWFVVVGDDGLATEGTWGAASDGSDRLGSTASGLCQMIQRSNAGSCP